MIRTGVQIYNCLVLFVCFYCLKPIVVGRQSG